MHQRWIKPFILFLCAALSPPAAFAANRLADHPSPYLALHAADPVDWRPWHEDVFADARAENRLVFVSVGYFSCHWCHVMQRESYQDPAIAELLNAKYVAVKVDRELDPDLDRRLIDFVEQIRGAAGWPLNVFLTPEGYPVTGFTYLPPGDFASVLRQLDDQWRREHERIAAAAREFFDTRMQDLENEAYIAPQIPAGELLDAFLSQAMLAADELQGGFGKTSKFPSVPQLGALLDIVAGNPDLDPDVAAFVRLTLDAMASNNLADHVNDGFFRYTTDPDWQTPHFEKMLYDNAQLARLYLDAHRLWPEAGYAGIAMRTLDFVESNLKHADGGYLSSLSAVDRDDREGGAYYWSRERLAGYLEPAEIEYLERAGILPQEAGEFLMPPLIGPGARGDPEQNRKIRQRLRARGSSSMPADDKRLAGWNAMLLDALVAAARLDPRYAARAEGLYRVIRRDFLRADGTLNRLAGNAEAAEAVFEDYAQVAHAFLAHGQASGDDEAVAIAGRLTERAQTLFLRQDRWRQKTRSLMPLAPGQWIIPDSVSASPMSLWLEVALAVPGLDREVRASAEKMLGRASRELLDAPYFYSSFILLRATHSG